MIWPDNRLIQWIENGGIIPPLLECVNPASIDLRLGGKWIDLEIGVETVSEEIELVPGMAILGTTLEYIKMPTSAAGVLYLKSSLARRGLDHSLAGFVDPGFKGELTMELHTHRPIVLRAGERVVQIVLYDLLEEPRFPYDGRYQGQRGPTRAKEN